MAFELRSPAFQPGEPIPKRYTIDGENLSPPLEWSGAPPGVRSFVLVMDDPDAPAGTFRHWGAYGIPAHLRSLPEGAGNKAAAAHAPYGLAVNSLGNMAYEGPGPPRGHGPHRYHFRLAALDVESLGFTRPPRVEELWHSAAAHRMAEALLIGIYRR